MQITTTFVSHNPKQVNGKNGQYTMHEFVDVNGLEFATSKTPIANQIYAALNSPIGIEYDEKQNGQYTNRYITNVLGAGAPAAGAAPTSAPAAPAQAAAPAAKPKLISDDEKQVLIMFQSFGNGAALTLATQLSTIENKAISVENWAAITKAMVVEAMKFSKDAVASVTAGGASSPGTGGGDAGAGNAPAPAQTDDGIPF